MATKQDLMNVNEVKSILGVGSTVAYRLISRLNKELGDKGFITIRGKVSRTYFMERMGLEVQ